jgi:hypothetical protein
MSMSLDPPNATKRVLKGAQFGLVTLDPRIHPCPVEPLQRRGRDVVSGFSSIDVAGGSALFILDE